MAHASNAAAAAAATSYQPAGAAPAPAQAAAPKDPKKDTGGRKVRFSVGHDYKVESVIGEGAYGIVVSARHKHGTRVAIKKISPFEHVLFALRTLRELKLLKYFTEKDVSENLITVLDIVKPSSFESFKEVYLVQELLETDLHRVIRTQDLSDDHCQYFVYQTCRAIKALHSANIVHRDLKPSNLLLNANCDLKVCDFGLARSTQTALPAENARNGLMTEYVATRWYRAPEVMLSFKQYTKAIDVWSIGCILAEMLDGRPLFPGKDYHHQLSLILDVLGTPSISDFQKITSRRSRDYLNGLPLRSKKHFEHIYKDANPLAIDFLKKTLTFDPHSRYTIEQCLEHPYLAAYHDPEDEPDAAPLPRGFFDFDLKKDDISREELKMLLYDEIMSFQPPPILKDPEAMEQMRRKREEDERVKMEAEAAEAAKLAALLDQERKPDVSGEPPRYYSQPEREPDVTMANEQPPRFHSQPERKPDVSNDGRYYSQPDVKPDMAALMQAQAQAQADKLSHYKVEDYGHVKVEDKMMF